MTAAKRAGAFLTVDLEAVTANWLLLAGRAAGAECAAVVKADAYGLGAAEVATALQDAGCRTFFVAHLEEGLSLRRTLGSGSRIFVLNGTPPDTQEEFGQAALTPVVGTINELQAWRKHAATKRGPIPVALQLDTGMSRLGLSPSDVSGIAADTTLLRGIHIELVMSHLACADEPGHSANESQRSRFQRLRRMLPQAPASIANSSGTFLGEGFHFSMIRPGAALYGINPTPYQANPMCQVVKLAARVLQVRQARAGTGIGYGHAARARRRSTLATIALGYADGWPRQASGAAYYRGQRLPFIGRVSMDSIILDVTGCSNPPREGDLVEFICPSQTVDEIGRLAGSIGYEVLTRLGRRFHRRYIRPIRRRAYAADPPCWQMIQQNEVTVMSATRRKVVVIGAGIIGVTSALVLQSEGHHVTLIDPAEPGTGASFGNAGCFNSSSIVPLALPGVLGKLPKWLADPSGPLSIRWSHLPRLAPWLYHFLAATRGQQPNRNAAALSRLIGSSVNDLEPLVRAFGLEHLVRRSGHLLAYRREDAFNPNDLAWRLRRENGIPFHEVRREELAQIEPALSGDYRFAIRFPDNGFTVDPKALLDGFLKAFLSIGGSFRHLQATGFAITGSTLTGIETPHTTLPCERAVIAAGIGSGVLARFLGEHLPLQAERGYHAFVPTDLRLNHSIMDADLRFVATPMNGGIRIAGLAEFAGNGRPPNWKFASALHDLGRGMLPGLPDDRKCASRWMGSRPSLPDSLPAIGRSHACGDIIHAFGHGHIGLTAAPKTARIIADLVGDRPPSIDVSDFNPGRFARRRH